MTELMVPTSGSTFYIPPMLDDVDVKIPLVRELYVQDGNNLLVDNITNHLWNCNITNKDPLRF